jgi:hypothetical protein
MISYNARIVYLNVRVGTTIDVIIISLKAA